MPDYNQIWIFSTGFHSKLRNIKFHGNPSSRSRADTCGQTDRKADMTNVIGPFFSQLCEREKKNYLTNYWHNRLYESVTSHESFRFMYCQHDSLRSNSTITQDGRWPQVQSTRQITTYFHLILPIKTKIYENTVGSQAPFRTQGPSNLYRLPPPPRRH